MTEPHRFPIRIYYEDTDFSGNVYHANFLKFIERARSELLRERDVHHSELAKSGLAFVVRHLDIWYDRPAHIDDALVVKTEIKEIRGARMELAQTVLRDDQVLVRAEVQVVTVAGSGKPVRLPPDILKRLTG